MGIALAAYTLAEHWHAGQFDKQQEPYILHPIRVGLTFENETLQAIGFLHDVLEDTDCTYAEIERHCGVHVARSVVALTRRDDEHYFTFIDRITYDYNASKVKLADIRDNMRPGWNNEPKRRLKYIRAVGVLLDAIDRHETIQQRSAS